MTPKFHILTILMIMVSMICISTQLVAQEKGIYSEVSELPRILNESSGLIVLANDSLISHNDSGGQPELIVFSAGSGKLLDRVRIKGAYNQDWEEIAQDTKHFYIGDFGNNSGSRKNLVIYRVPKSILKGDKQTSVDHIYFSYPEQKKFRPGNFHNYDCEAMLIHEDQIFLFTKNRSDYKSNIYVIPSKPGRYDATMVGTLEVDGLITGADISPEKDMIALLGYTFMRGNRFKPFIHVIYDFKSFDIKSGKTIRIDLAMVKQTEGICFKDNSTIYFTEEEENENDSFLYEMNIRKFLND